jgi:hypothetical protein
MRRLDKLDADILLIKCRLGIEGVCPPARSRRQRRRGGALRVSRAHPSLGEGALKFADVRKETDRCVYPFCSSWPSR